MRHDDRALQRALDHLAETVHTLSGRPIASEVHALFARYLELLLLWNRTQRLTGFESPAEIVRGLFEDSLLFWPLLPPRPLRMVDIGAGAGIPGIPLRIVDPGIRLTLIESRRKRVSFLKMITRELGLANDIVVAEGRAEVLVADLVGSSGAFDVAVARGVGSFESVLPIAQRYLVVGGLFIASGPPPARPPSVDSRSGVRWQVVDNPKLGLKRGFFIAERLS